MNLFRTSPAARARLRFIFARYWEAWGSLSLSPLTQLGAAGALAGLLTALHELQAGDDVSSQLVWFSYFGLVVLALALINFIVAVFAVRQRLDGLGRFSGDWFLYRNPETPVVAHIPDNCEGYIEPFRLPHVPRRALVHWSCEIMPPNKYWAAQVVFGREKPQVMLWAPRSGGGGDGYHIIGDDKRMWLVVRPLRPDAAEVEVRVRVTSFKFQ